MSVEPDFMYLGDGAVTFKLETEDGTMLTKGLAPQKQRSAQDGRMLELLSRDESYVSMENLSEVLQWYRAEQ